MFTGIFKRNKNPYLNVTESPIEQPFFLHQSRTLSRVWSTSFENQRKPGLADPEKQP